MKKYCFINEKITAEDKAAVNIKDLGVLRGYGVFDFLRTYNGKPFLLKEHLARLRNSAKTVGLRVPAPDPEISRKINALLKKNGHREAAIKIIVTGGRSKDGLTHENHPTTIITTREIPPLSRDIYEKGIKLITCEYQRNNPGAKTIDYITMLKLQKRKRKEKAFEILYVDKGYILEGATSNFFLFAGDKLITPKNNVLIGTTRNFILKAARKRFGVEERDVKTGEIKRATEAFITSTTREILPVVKIDNIMIGNGRVGDNTKALMEIFKNYAENF
ncbi:MAG: aminotransferase class IV [Candidatus Falkowbacteria bacterium]